MALVLLLPFSASADETTVDDVLDAIRAASNEIRTARGTYSQTRRLEIIPEPLTDTGVFYVDRRDASATRTLLAIDGEFGARHLLIGSTMTVVYPEFKEAEVYDLSEPRLRSFQSLMTLQVPMNLQDLFAVTLGDTTDQLWRLQLEPKDESVRKLLMSASVDVDRKSGFVTRMQTKDTNGDTMEVSITSFDSNVELDGSVFSLSLDGYTVTRNGNTDSNE
jgi:outer membrane lipoprotein-sorting protein